MLEPFHIALRRQLSALHPVHKLMLPHFRYTLNINTNARVGLVNAGGVIEGTFSAGEYAMQLTSIVYRSWTLVGQALPADLVARCGGRAGCHPAAPLPRCHPATPP